MKTNWAGVYPALTTHFRADYSLDLDATAKHLDLLIRSRSQNARSLDDAFRNLRRLSWEQPNALYYLQGRGYTEDDVERAVSEAAGADLHDWFTRYVGGVDDPDFDEALGWAGLRLVRGASEWSIVELPAATPAQLRVRAGWVSGRAS